MALRWQLARQFGAAALLVCLVCLASWREFADATAPDTVSETIESYDELKSSLPAHGVACYFSDKDVEAQAFLWYLAEYSLAPLVLRPGSDCEWLIGRFENPGTVNTLDSLGLRIERSYGPQLLLLRRKQP
jgi:hypothetical protein